MASVTESFAARHGIPVAAINGTGHGGNAAADIQNTLSWYHRGWDRYMSEVGDAETEEQAYAMADESFGRAARHNASLGQHRQEQINGYVDAWRSRHPVTV